MPHANYQPSLEVILGKKRKKKEPYYDTSKKFSTPSLRCA